MSAITVADALARAVARLAEGETDTPRLDAEILLGHVLQRGRAWIMTHGDDSLTEAQLADFGNAIERRADGTPVAYLTGTREFWSLDLAVSPDVLIPRPETELLVELGLASLGTGNRRVLDLGTGSGAIALAVASERPDVEVTGVDRSSAAIDVARANARRLGIGNARFIRSDWFDALQGQVFDLVLANPPYVADGDPHLAGEVRFEPRSALVAEDNGLADLRAIIHAAPRFLAIGGSLMVEHGCDQADAVEALFNTAGFRAVETVHDLAGLPRVTRGQCSQRIRS